MATKTASIERRRDLITSVVFKSERHNSDSLLCFSVLERVQLEALSLTFAALVFFSSHVGARALWVVHGPPLMFVIAEDNSAAQAAFPQ